MSWSSPTRAGSTSPSRARVRSSPMYFSGSARLSERFPELGDLPARLDQLLRDLGGGDLLEPEALASELGVSAEQMQRMLALAAEAAVQLLVAERLAVCPRCAMLNPA